MLNALQAALGKLAITLTALSIVYASQPSVIVIKPPDSAEAVKAPLMAKQPLETPYLAGKPVLEEDIEATIEQLIQCESKGVSEPAHWDVNDYAYGILQFHSSTWNGWSKQFNFEGSPMRPGDAREMTRKALRAGYLNLWTCAFNLGLLKK